MTDLDPYVALGEKLIAAAERQAGNGRAATSKRAWRSHRLNAVVIAAVLLLAGGAIAIAAAGLLTGSPVKREGPPLEANTALGIPAAGGSRLLSLRAIDPEGGPPWGMRLVHTTRGELCLQVGRVQGEQLGELGIDGSFHDDGRFHPISPAILPSYSEDADTTCILAGQTTSSSFQDQERSAAPINQELLKVEPQERHLRSISFGLLGPHALSITYRTKTGLQTRSVSEGTGAYLIIEMASHHAHLSFGGGSFIGYSTGRNTSMEPTGEVVAITYRFGPLTCSVSRGTQMSKRCPRPRPTPESRFAPTRSLHQPVHVMTVLQSPASCSRAFLLNPCYRAEVSFKAPYVVTNAGSEYSVEAGSHCKNARPSSWGINRDVKRGETVHTLSTGLFRLCASADEFEIRYLNNTLTGKSASSPHESVIVGTGVLGATGHSGRRMDLRRSTLKLSRDRV
ncbi:MAG: hypothetical protein ACLPYW_02375 [Acidimicrobiales bacterium]